MGNRTRRGCLGRQTRERRRKRGMKGGRGKRSWRGETFYLRGEYRIYVRVKKKGRKGRICRLEEEKGGDGCGLRESREDIEGRSTGYLRRELLPGTGTCSVELDTSDDSELNSDPFQTEPNFVIGLSARSFPPLYFLSI
jgi:hypothetical protein